ncbi:MAG: glucose-6-phosphate isomerase, partial [Chloroflexi bacterium]|nr:glucose-6-phosphate isomerase [Chloroflexota bacterium]
KLPKAMGPMAGPESDGDDRLFAYLRLDGDDNGATDAHAANLEWAGHPVLRENLADLYDLGASFYRWEFATTVAGALLDIHPFNQPNVQGSKDSTVRLLSEYQSTGRFPGLKSDHTLGSLLDEANAGDYVAIMVYLDESPETDAAVAELRRVLLERHRLPSTLGYGPRFLHSTGQLHKGGKQNGLFLQIVGGDYESVPIPGESYGFDVLVAAQSAGDFQVLNQRGLPIARVELSGDYPARLLSLSEGI